MAKKQITVPVFVPHSGCPHCCVFCNQWRVSSAKKQPDRDSIAETVREYIGESREGIERVEIAFFGGTFTAIDVKKQRELLESVIPYVKDGLIDGIRLSTRPDYIDRERLDLLSEFSVETVELGVQSFNDTVLSMSERGHSSDDVRNAMGLLKKYRFRTGIQLMPGLPGDSLENTLFSARETVGLCPDDVRIYPALVLRDTKMEKLYHEGKYSPLSVESAVEICAPMYRMFADAGINVIRMGLHPFDISEADSVIAGPYHPAMGFLIKSRYRRDFLEEAVRSWILKNGNPERMSIVIPVQCREEYIGLKRSNILYIKDKFGLKRVDCSYDSTAFPVVLS